MNKKRLDVLIFERGLAESREKAQRLVLAGQVRLNGQTARKAGHRFAADVSIEIAERPRFVSRGGDKLEAAFSAFDIDVDETVCIDVGASTGGFTDCLLQHGAKKVIAVDVGYGQLAWKLRQDPRVFVMERTNIRHVEPGDLPMVPDLAVIDVSFISLKLVVPVVLKLLASKCRIVAMVKPQFEVGKGQVGKKGVVRDPAKHIEVLDNMKGAFIDMGLSCQGPCQSPITGPKGNKEFFFLLSRNMPE